MSHVFGNLRSLLQRPSSDELWQELCEMLDHMVEQVDEAQWEELVAYTRGSLQHWPLERCLAPSRWVEQMFEGKKVPQLAVARAIDTRGQDVGDEHIFELTLTTELSGLESLSMGYAQRVAWRPERLDYGCIRELCTCSHLDKIRVLRLVGQHLLPDSFTSVLSPDSSLSNTRHLDFSFNDLNFLKPSDLSPIQDTQLRDLLLRQTNLNSQGIFTLESSTLLNNLETFDLSANRQLAHADLMHLFAKGRPMGKTLRTLHLDEMPFEAEQLIELLGFVDLPQLRTLTLSRNLLSEPSSAEHVLRALHADTMCGLVALGLDELAFDAFESDMNDLLTLWAGVTCSPKRMSLQHNQLSALSLPWIAELLRSGVTQLDLRHNSLHPAAFEGLLEHLESLELSEPVTIKLDYNYIPPEDEGTQTLKTLAKGLGVHIELEHAAVYYDPQDVMDEDLDEYYEDNWEG